MTRSVVRLLGLPMVVLVLAALASPAAAATPVAPNALQSFLSGSGHLVRRGQRGAVSVNACSAPASPGAASCDAYVRTDLVGKSVSPAPYSPSSAGSEAAIGNQGAYDPAFLQSAYNAPSATNGAGQTIAIVDAYDSPTVESDLTAYRAFFGLPVCTTENGCFRKVNQSGGTAYPVPNSGWELEIALDVDMASAICPNCKIVLVEATNNSFQNLGAAVKEAVKLGANVVSNSYSGTESSDDTQSDAAFFNHPGIAVVAATGDNGYGVGYPASSPDVVAVGGTSLVQENNTGTRDAVETAWSDAGSGCSTVEPKPAWQTDTGCAHKSVADVSAVADPDTGVWVYISSPQPGWEIVGGTSAATPIVSAFYALAGNGPSTANLSSYPYAHSSELNDVVAGTNGTCGGTYLCVAGPGYDGPTGLGTPNTAAAFSAGGVQVVAPPPGPDFSIATTSLSGPLKPNATAKSTITLTSLNGDTGTASLSVAVSPSTGLSASLSPSSVAVGATAGTSKLSFVAHKGGTYTVTITATQGAIVHKASLKVSVNDFSIRVAHTKESVVRGNKVHYTVMLAPAGSFKSQVTLSTAGLRPGDSVSYSRNPAPASGTQTVTIATSRSASRGARTLRFTGVSGTLRHSVEVVLSVQ